MPIDRNERARLIWTAEVYERRTKGKGARAGALCESGLKVLRCIAFRFLNAATAIAFPSYDALQAATGLCRQTIANAIRRLERGGFLIVTRRAGWNGRMVVRETNLYELPSRPPAPEWESLLSRRQPHDSRFIPWDEWDGPLKHALVALGERIDKSNEAGAEKPGGFSPNT